MITVTPEELTEFRSQLIDNPEATAALDKIEKCSGNLQAATQLIAEETTNEKLLFREDSYSLEKLAEKFSKIICGENFGELLTGVLTVAIATLASLGNIPVALATPIIIYVSKIGVKKFCATEKLE